MHACTPAHGAYVFSQNKLPNTRSERVLLGDKSPPPPSLYENKNTQRGGGSMYTPSVHRSQQGLLIVTCARSAPSQSPVSQMHAGRSGPPTSSWQLPRGREVVGVAVLLEEGAVCQEKDSWRGPGPWFLPSILSLQKVNLDPAQPQTRSHCPGCYKVSVAASAAYPPFENPQVCQSGSFLGFHHSKAPWAAFSTINPPLPCDNQTKPPTQPSTCTACLTPASPEGASCKRPAADAGNELAWGRPTWLHACESVKLPDTAFISVRCFTPTPPCPCAHSRGIYTHRYRETEEGGT